jgi:hypothetical protein
MNPEASVELIKVPATLEPRWALAFMVSAMLCYRSPQLVRELFAGLRGLIVALKHTRRRKLKSKLERPMPTKLSSAAYPTVARRPAKRESDFSGGTI